MIENKPRNFDGRPEGLIWWVYDHPLTLLLLVAVVFLIGGIIVGPTAAATVGAGMLGFAAKGYGGGS